MTSHRKGYRSSSFRLADDEAALLGGAGLGVLWGFLAGDGHDVPKAVPLVLIRPGLFYVSKESNNQEHFDNKERKDSMDYLVKDEPRNESQFRAKAQGLAPVALVEVLTLQALPASVHFGEVDPSSFGALLSGSRGSHEAVDVLEGLVRARAVVDPAGVEDVPLALLLSMLAHEDVAAAWILHVLSIVQKFS